MTPKRKKPFRRYGRRYWPMATKMALMGLGSAFGSLHPRKGWRPITKFERFMLNREPE